MEPAGSQPTRCESCGAGFPPHGYGPVRCKKCGTTHVFEPPKPAAAAWAPDPAELERRRAAISRRLQGLDQQIASLDPFPRWAGVPGMQSIVGPMASVVVGIVIMASAERASVFGMVALVWGGLLIVA